MGVYTCNREFFGRVQTCEPERMSKYLGLCVHMCAISKGHLCVARMILCVCICFYIEGEMRCELTRSAGGLF